MTDPSLTVESLVWFFHRVSLTGGRVFEIVLDELAWNDIARDVMLKTRWQGDTDAKIPDGVVRFAAPWGGAVDIVRDERL